MPNSVAVTAALAVWAVTHWGIFAAHLAFAALGTVLSGLAFQAIAG